MKYRPDRNFIRFQQRQEQQEYISYEIQSKKRLKKLRKLAKSKLSDLMRNNWVYWDHISHKLKDIVYEICVMEYNSGYWSSFYRDSFENDIERYKITLKGIKESKLRVDELITHIEEKLSSDEYDNVLLDIQSDMRNHHIDKILSD